jgi:hypothetical protein
MEWYNASAEAWRRSFSVDGKRLVLARISMERSRRPDLRRVGQLHGYRGWTRVLVDVDVSDSGTAAEPENPVPLTVTVIFADPNVAGVLTWTIAALVPNIRDAKNLFINLLTA